MDSTNKKFSENFDSQGEILNLLENSYKSRINDTQISIELGQKALILSKKLGSSSLIAKSLNRLSLIYMITGEFDKAMKFAEEGMTYFQSLKDEKGIAESKYTIASVHYKTNNFHLGLINLIDCISTYRKYHDYHNLSRSCKSIGTIYEYFGDQKNAIKSYKEAIRAGKKTGDPNLESNVYNPLSGIYLKQNNFLKASQIIELAIKIKTKTGDLRGLAFSLYGRAKVNMSQKNYWEAEKDFQSAIEIHLKTGESLGLGMAYHKIGGLYLEMDQYEKAKEILYKGVEYSKKHTIVLILYKCYYLLYKIYKIENNTQEALYFLEQFHLEKDSVINKQTLKLIENYELIQKMEAKEKKAQMQKAEILKKKEFAEQTARLKQNFLSTMSHEIRTPLNAVITIASLLSEKGKTEEEIQLIQSLRFSSNNLLMIVNDFLDFTKLDVGKAQLDYRPVNIFNLFENIINTYRNLAQEKGLYLRLRMDEDIHPNYELDEFKMAQIIGNLVTNSIDFTEKGGVEVFVRKISGSENLDKLLFQVSDTGIGIERKQLDNIFEMFYQSQSLIRRSAGGTGLGLAIVKKLLDLKGSKIKVRSDLGKGTSFEFKLGLKKSKPPVSVNQDTFYDMSGKEILVAEDNDINALLVRKLLSRWNIETDIARNGIEAVEKADQKVYDYILMDIHMPEMDGYEATRIIQNEGKLNSKTPVFALTADVLAETNEEYKMVFDGFLRKPIEVDKLYEALLDYITMDSE